MHWLHSRSIGARIEEEAAVSLAQRSSQSGTVEPSICARLDTDLFEETAGQKMVFRHVRLSFLPTGDASALREREIVFMRGAELVKTPNDAYLKLEAPSGLLDSDIGKDVRRVGVRLYRRRFSARESLLRRIADQGEMMALDGKIFPVRLYPVQGTADPAVRDNVTQSTLHAKAGRI